MRTTKRCATWCRHETKRGRICNARQRLAKFLLRLDLAPPDVVRPWTKAYQRWLETLRVAHPAQQIVLAELAQMVLAVGSHPQPATVEAAPDVCWSCGGALRRSEARGYQSDQPSIFARCALSVPPS